MDYEEADKNALVQAERELAAKRQRADQAVLDREEIVGWHLDNEHQSVCLKDADGYTMGDWRPLPRHEADEFGDECIVCREFIVPLADEADS